MSRVMTIDASVPATRWVALTPSHLASAGTSSLASSDADPYRHYVLGLQVAMHDPHRVRELQAFEQLAESCA